jgi:zinc transport system substrate-binding protein
MVEAIGGDLVKVTVMVPPGDSPHTYAPVPSQMKQVARAKAYFEVGSGVEFELNHLDELKAQNNDMKVFDCSEGITLLELDGHDHDHGGDDPHIWLSPVNTMTMVENIYNGLIKVDKANEVTYKANMDDYLSRLDSLHVELQGRFSSHEDKVFLSYHPGWGYFAHEYRIEQIAVEEGGKEPGPAGIAAIVEQAKDLNITTVFVDPQFDPSRAETIATELDGKVVTLDPLAIDYIDNLRTVSKRLVEGLSNG